MGRDVNVMSTYRRGILHEQTFLKVFVDWRTVSPKYAIQLAIVNVEWCLSCKGPSSAGSFGTRVSNTPPLSALNPPLSRRMHPFRK